MLQIVFTFASCSFSRVGTDRINTLIFWTPCTKITLIIQYQFRLSQTIGKSFHTLTLSLLSVRYLAGNGFQIVSSQSVFVIFVFQTWLDRDNSEAILNELEFPFYLIILCSAIRSLVANLVSFKWVAPRSSLTGVIWRLSTFTLNNV